MGRMNLQNPLSGLGLVVSPNAPTFNASSSRQNPSTTRGARIRSSTLPALGSLPRTSSRMSGLLNAETGGAMVELDPLGGGSGFREGCTIGPDIFSPHERRNSEANPRASSRASSRPTTISRNASSSTLRAIFSQAISDEDSNSSDRDSNTDIRGHRNQRLQMDIELATNTVVEGNPIQGTLVLKIPKIGKKENPVLISTARLRVVGFEGISYDKHTFYQHSEQLDAVAPTFDNIFASPTHSEGFRQAREGLHRIPFSYVLPLAGGAKGSVVGRSSVSVRYIILASIKTRDQETDTKSLAHFYRVCHIFPSFDAGKLLVPATRPLIATSAKTLFLSGSGRMTLTCGLHRRYWIAGQHCWIKIFLQNNTSKRVKSLTVTLYRNTTTFRILPQLNPGIARSAAEVDIDACQASTSRKQIAEVILESAQKGLRGSVSAKGWWSGVEPGTQSELSYYIEIPHDALTIPRSRLVEIDYFIRVTANTGALGNDVHAELPLTVINSISLYQPPVFKLTQKYASTSISPLKVDIYPARDGSRSHFLRHDPAITSNSFASKRARAVSFSAHSQVCTITSPGRSQRGGISPSSIKAGPKLNGTLTTLHKRSRSLPDVSFGDGKTHKPSQTVHVAHSYPNSELDEDEEFVLVENRALASYPTAYTPECLPQPPQLNNAPHISPLRPRSQTRSSIPLVFRETSPVKPVSSSPLRSGRLGGPREPPKRVGASLLDTESCDSRSTNSAQTRSTLVPLENVSYADGQVQHSRTTSDDLVRMLSRDTDDPAVNSDDNDDLSTLATPRINPNSRPNQASYRLIHPSHPVSEPGAVHSARPPSTASFISPSGSSIKARIALLEEHGLNK